MKRVASILALALVAALPLAASAKHKPSPAPDAAAATAMVTCKTGDAVVWVNTESKVYHLSGTTYYGKTKHGKYACESDAKSMGDKPAKREKGGAMSAGSAMESPDPMTGKKKHHHGSMMASPAPAAT